MNFEKTLVDALKSKNKERIEEAFNIIYDAFFKLVYFCVASIVKDKEDVEELVSDVFLNFFNHLDNIKLEGNIKYYLTTSAKNRALNFVKKQNKIILTDKIENVSSSIDYHDFEYIEKMKKILTDEEFELVYDHVLLGKKLIDIALENNANSNTIKSKYRRAIKKLRRFLGGKNYE